MNRKMADRLAYFFLILLMPLVLCRPGFSQDDAEKKKKAKKHFARALEFFDMGKYEDALIDFEASYTYRSHWKLKYNMALCHYKLGHHLEAAVLTKQFLAEGKNKISAEEKKLAENVLDDLRTKMGVLTITGKVKGAVIKVDGKVQKGVKPGDEVFLLPGKHHVLVTSKSQVYVDEDIVLKAGLSKEIRVTLLEVEKKPVVDPEPAPDKEKPALKPVKAKTEAKTRKADRKPPSMSTAGWAVLGVGSAFLAAGIVMGGLAGHERTLMKDAEDEYMTLYDTPGATQEELDLIKEKRNDHYDRGLAYLFSMAGLLAAGCAAAGASVALLFISSKKKTETRVLTGPELSLGPGSLTLRLHF
jgi:tetratricopeptide (TPR) repeat protein